MSTYSESLVLPVDTASAAEACRTTFEDGGWTVLDSGAHEFFVRERYSLPALLLYYPMKAAIFLHEDEPGTTRVEAHGKNFGFGPLQADRVRKGIQGLLNDIAQAAEEVAAPE